MANLDPITLADFDGIGTRWDEKKVPPGKLVKGHNVRFNGQSIGPRPGQSIAIRVPAIAAAKGAATFLGSSLLTGSGMACPDCAFWDGCLTESFSDSTHWTSYGASIVFNADGTLTFTAGFGHAYYTAGCGSGTEQEVEAIFGSQTRGSVPGGNYGWLRTGPGARMAGSTLLNSSGYFFAPQIVGGGSGITCAQNNVIFILDKMNVGVVTNLANTYSVTDPLAKGLPLRIIVTTEGGNARIKCYAGSTLIYNVLDATPLAAGRVGIAAYASCSGVIPDVTWTYIKARNL